MADGAATFRSAVAGVDREILRQLRDVSPTPSSTHPKPHTLNPKSRTLNPKP